MLRLKLYFAWYDLWIGAYYDAKKRRLYICPLPCCVIEIDVATYFEMWSHGCRIGYTTNSGGIGEVESNYELRPVSKKKWLEAIS